MNDCVIKVFLIKVTARCNINCTYCYEYNLEDKSYRGKPSRMTFEVFCKATERIREHVVKHNLHQIAIVFHGGEPLLAGRDFFEYAIQHLNFQLKDLCEISYAMQTNGILINSDWIELFKRCKINIGVSLDGDRSENDKFRLDFKGNSTFDKTLEGVNQLLKEENKQLLGGILCVMQPDTDAVSLFKWFLSLGEIKVDFLFPHYNHVKTPERLYNEEQGYGYGVWLSQIFDYWWKNDLHHIKIRIFEDIIHLLLGGKYSVESLGLSPIQLVVIQTDGEYEAVDSFKSSFDGAVSTKLSVHDNPVDSVFDHPLIGTRISRFENLCEECKTCNIVKVCGGGYIPHRYHRDFGFLAPTIYCKDLMFLIKHIENEVLKEVVDGVPAVSNRT